MERYELQGFIIAENLYGYKGFANLCIHTNENGYKEILSNPLQDYLNYGGVEVVYAYFKVIKIRTFFLNSLKMTIEKEIKEIEAGDRTALDMDNLMQGEYIEISY